MSKIKRKYVEKYLHGINTEVLNNNKIIYGTNDYSKHLLDPNGQDRNISFSTDFLNGDIITIKNIGSNNNLIITSITPNKQIRPDEQIQFYYYNNTWSIYSNEFKDGYLESDSNGDLMPRDDVSNTSDCLLELDNNSDLMPKL